MLRILLTLGSLQFLTMLILLVRTKALALLLGPELVGVMSVVDKLLAVMAQTATFSLPFAAVRFLPSLWASNRTAFHDLYARMRNVLLFLIALVAVGGGAVTLLRPEAWGPGLQPYRGLILVGLLCLPVMAGTPFLQNVIAARFQQNRAILFFMAHAAVFTVSGVVGALVAGLIGLYSTYAILGTLLIAIAFMRQERAPRETGTTTTGTRPESPSGLTWSLALPRPVLKFSTTLLVLAFLAPYGAWYVHFRVLTDLGPTAAGWMAAAIGISLAVRGVLGAAHPVFLTPNVNRGGSPAERMVWANNFYRTLCCAVLILVPPLLLFPRLAVELLYSAEFGPASAFVALFVGVELLTLLAGVHSSLLIAFDHLNYHVLQNVLAQLVLIGGAVLLIPRYGIGGAAAAALAAQVLLHAGTLVFLYMRHRLLMPARAAILLPFVAVCLAFAGMLGADRPGFGLYDVGLKAALYIATVVLLGMLLTDEDRAGLRRLISRGRVRATATTAP